MSKIGDLFVRLGLKKDEFSRGLKEAKNESSSFASVLQSIGSKGKIAFAAITTAIVGTIAAVKSLSRQNQALGDAWNRMSASMAASWDTFRTAVANMDFSHLLNDLREGVRLAQDLYDARDALGEIGTSYNLELSRQLQHINELKVKLRDLNLSDKERIAAGNELLQIYLKLEKNPTRGLSNVSDKSLEVMAQKLGYNLKGASEGTLKKTRGEVEQFFIWLGSEAGEAWNKAYAEAYKDPGKLFQTTLNAQAAGLSNNMRAMLWNYQGRVGDKDREMMEEAVTAYYQQQAKYSGETLRIQNQINSITAQSSNKGHDAASAAAAAAQAQEEAARKSAEAILKRAEDSGKSEIQLMTEKFNAEKALLEQFGLDTEALWNEYINNLIGTWGEGFEEFQDDLEDIEPFEIDPVLLDDSELEEFAKKMKAQFDAMEDLARQFNEAVVSGISDGCQEIMNQLMGVSDLNAGAIFKALLEPLADLAIKEGEILMATGIGVEAIKGALTKLAGPAAIAAGAALIAIGTAAKAGLAALANGGAASTSASTYQGGAGAASTQTIRTELEVVVTGRISGRDILLSGQRTSIDNNR